MVEVTTVPIPIEKTSTLDYNNENYIEVHLDERLYVEDHLELCRVRKSVDNCSMIIDKTYKTFHDANQCLTFITSYEWRKVFLTLTDQFSYLLELIHDLPQIVFFYIYSACPSGVLYKSEQYPKLRSMVQDDSSDRDRQLSEDITLFKRDLMPMQVRKPIKRETKLLIQEALNMNEYSIIWLQNNDYPTRIDTSSLSKLIGSLKIFSDLDQCLDLIKASHDIQIFFITSRLESDVTIDQLSSYSQIIAIYILQTDQENVAKLPSSKLHGVYSDLPSLAVSLSAEYERRRKCSRMPASVFENHHGKTVRDLSKDNVKILWFQLLMDILLSIPYNNQARDEMLLECAIHYGIPSEDDQQIEEKKYDRNAEKDMLDLAKNYNADEALKYYTKDSFLYRLFNQALRMENIDLLFICRFFLADTYKHLQKLYKEQLPNQLPHTVFRGQFMTEEEFRTLKDNIGGSMSINTFLSTTEDRDVAELFSGLGADPNMLSIVFEIEVNVEHLSIKRPVASIAAWSRFPAESEILFSVGSIFRIESVSDTPTALKYWHVRLKLIEDDSDINELRKELEATYCDGSDLSHLGAALITMGDYPRAERYFHILAEYVPEDNPTMYRINSSLGKIARHKGNYQTALDYHEKAVKDLQKPEIYNVEAHISEEYVDIAGAHHALGNLDLAMKYFTMALDIPTSPKSLSYTYNQLALLYRAKGEKHLALEYFQKSLHIHENVLKRNRYAPELATGYNNIGEMYSQLGAYDKALEHLNKALDIRLKGTVSTHKDHAAIYNNLGAVYHQTNRLEEALDVFEKALQIDTKALGSNHHSVAVDHSHIAVIYHTMNDVARALYHYETALRVLIRSHTGKDHSEIGIFQYSIGALQVTLGNFTKALKIAEKALQNQLRLLPANDQVIAHTYRLLSQIFRKEKTESAALECMEKAVEVARISILPNNKAIFEAFQTQLDSMKKDQLNGEKRFQQVATEISYTPDNSDLQDCLLSNYSEELTQISSDNRHHSFGEKKLFYGDEMFQ